MHFLIALLQLQHEEIIGVVHHDLIAGWAHLGNERVVAETVDRLDNPLGLEAKHEDQVIAPEECPVVDLPEKLIGMNGVAEPLVTDLGDRRRMRMR
jgi:hypothetical protein